MCHGEQEDQHIKRQRYFTSNESSRDFKSAQHESKSTSSYMQSLLYNSLPKIPELDSHSSNNTSSPPNSLLAWSQVEFKINETNKES